jgi:predicted short-subunit dehydrogenase-like oxidoreductase (DUF2520 family)
MSTTRINFIGCGKLGKTLARLFASNNLATIAGVLNSSAESARNAVNFIGQGIACRTMHELPTADLYFITVRDDLIETISNQLAQENIYKRGTIIVHCSGSLSSEILVRARESGCYLASVHPIKSFANPEQSVASFTGTYCGLEGDENIKPYLINLFSSIGGIPFVINKEQKRLYHMAGVIANNYLVTLHHQAFGCYKEAGVDETTAKNIVSMLMRGALDNINNLTHEKALTGPIQRGDASTVQNHIKELNDRPLTKSIYSSLGIATLPLTKHSEQKKSELKSILKSDNEYDRKNSRAPTIRSRL